MSPHMSMCGQVRRKQSFGFMTVAINAGFPAHEIGGILRHLKENRTGLLSAWNEYFGA
jgi:hypothetical protein